MTTREIGGVNPEEAKRVFRAGKVDLRPEYCNYRDEGCEYARSCLRCPYPQCLYDGPGGKQRWFRERRNREINRLFMAGWKIRELAELFRVSQRTVQRALENTLSGKLHVIEGKGKRQEAD